MLQRTLNWRRLVPVVTAIPTNTLPSVSAGTCSSFGSVSHNHNIFQRTASHHRTFSSVRLLQADSEQIGQDEKMFQLRSVLLQQQASKTQFCGKKLEEAAECIQWWARRASRAENVETGRMILQQANDLFHHVNKLTNDMSWRCGMYPKATIVYNSLLSAWVELNGCSPSPDAMLSRLRDIQDFPLDNQSYGFVMDAAIANMPRERVPIFCEDVLRKMIEFPSKGIGDSKWPTTETFTRCYTAWGICGRRDASERAYALFRFHKSTKFTAAAIDANCLSALLRALLQSTVPNLVSLKEQRFRLNRANEVIEEVSEVSLLLNASHYEFLVDSWLNLCTFGRRDGHSMDDAMEEARKLWRSLNKTCGSKKDSDVSRILERMLYISLSNRPTLCDLRQSEKLLSECVNYIPSREILIQMVTAYARQDHLQDAERAMGFIEKLFPEPDVLAYGSLVSAWWRRGLHCTRNRSEKDVLFAAGKAEAYLLRMMRLSESCDHVPSFPCRLLTCRVVDLWVKARNAQKIESFLTRIQSFYLSTGYSFAKPKTDLLLHVMRAYSKLSHLGDDNAACRASRLLVEMHDQHLQGDTDVRPTNDCYMSVVGAWARSKRRDRIDRCVEVFDKLRLAHQAGILGVQPDCKAYFEMFQLFSSHGDSSNSIRLLEQMFKDHAAGNILATPDIATINMVLLTCLRSNETVHAAQQALKVYNILRSHEQRFGLKPNIKTHSLFAEIFARDKAFALEENFFTNLLHKEKQVDAMTVHFAD